MIFTSFDQKFSSILSITAPSEAPPNFSGRAVTSTTIELMWDTIAPENRNGIVHHYLISVVEVETSEMNNYTAVSTQVNISSLHPYYTYTCSVAAVTNKVGPFSQSISIVTPQEGCIGYHKVVTIVSDTYCIY